MPTSVQVVIGPNGAGKSTLMDTIIGRVRPVTGRVMFKGADMVRLPEYEIVRRGICRKFQTPGILPTLTVEEKSEWRRSAGADGWVHAIAPPREHPVAEILDIIGLREKRKCSRPISRMAPSNGSRSAWWCRRTPTLLLDEPAAGMTHQERGRPRTDQSLAQDGIHLS